MLKPDHKVVIGEHLVVDATGLAFTAKCSCPSSKPREHTARYVAAHRDLYSTLPEWTAAHAPSTKDSKS